jgi:hypothetical protein
MAPALLPSSDAEARGGTADAVPGPMLDLALVLAAVAFFAVAWAYVRICERLGGTP